MLKEIANETEQIEEAQIDLRAAICRLSEADRRQRLKVNLITKEQLRATQKSDAGASVSVLEGVSTTTTFKKEFNISGQIGDSRRKDRLSFTSLAHQINAGLNRGYQEEKVIKAVIRVVNPGLRIRSYLEGKPDLTLANLRKILRSHYQEKEDVTVT